VAWLRSMVFDQSLVTEELIEQRWALATEPDTLEVARRMYGRAAITAAFAGAGSSAQATPGWAQFDQIRARTLLTWGRDDRVSPLDMMLIPMRTIPDVEVHVFANCGHWAMIEQKRAWERTVLAFLNEQDEEHAA
jgi:2-hydroxy-6-oxonona-2,4-dienedioate hydrolase